MTAGRLYSPSDCKKPTIENARPTNTTIGNMILVRLTDSAAVASESSGAMNFTRSGAKASPKAVIASVISRMRLIYEDKKEC